MDSTQSDLGGKEKDKMADTRMAAEEDTTAHEPTEKERVMNARTKTYVEAARRGKENWWRYVLGIVLVVFLWLGLGGVLSVALILAFSGAELQSLADPFANEVLGQIEGYLALSVGFPVFLLGTVLATALIHRRHPRTLVTAADSISWGRVARGFGVWFALVCMAGLVAFSMAPSSFSFRPDWATFVPFALLALILTPIQTTSEELFFRGYLAQAGARISRSPVFLVIAPSILFMLLHLLNPELSYAKNAFDFLLFALYYFAVGAFLMWISLKDGTIELAIGLHAAYNLFAAVLLTFKGSSLDTPALFYADQGPNPIVTLVGFLAMAVLFYLAIFGLPRRKPAGEASTKALARPAEQGQPNKPAGATAGASAEQNKAVVLRYIEEVWNRYDLGAIDGLVSSGYVNHAASTEEYRRGGARRIWEWILSVFPDHRFDVEGVAAEGETVAVRGTMTGSHEGELMGIAPTGKRVAARQSHWFRVVDGELAEHWAVRDDLGMLRQLGVVPS